MATPREIKNRIKTIKNTRKITSTMEMVSTAKMKKVQTRLTLSKPYETKVVSVINNIVSTSGGSLADELFKEVAEPTKTLVFQITGNRGLCGSYNTNVIANTMKFKQKLEAEGKEVSLYVIGKKAQGYYKFINQPMYKYGLNPEDKVTFEMAAQFSEELKQVFLKGEFHEIYISYTKVISSSSQKPEIFRLLPIQMEEEKQDTGSVVGTELDYIFEPNPHEFFHYLLPLYQKVRLFSCFLESSYSEQFARRVAMKNASDASKEMIRELTISYNRARQAKITNEIAEIVGGAAALE